MTSNLGQAALLGHNTVGKEPATPHGEWGAGLTYGPPKGSNTSLCSAHPRKDTLDPQIQRGSWVPEFGALLGATRRLGSLTTGLAGSWGKHRRAGAYQDPQWCLQSSATGRTAVRERLQS